MRRHLALLLAMTVTANLPAYGFGQCSTDAVQTRSRAVSKADLTELEKVVAAEMISAGIPGAAVAIVQGDKLIYSKGFGKTSVEGGSVVTDETLFRIGSATKMFTAAAFAELASQGRASFDQPVAKYVNGLSPKVGELTAHQLLSQSSGVRDFGAPVTSDDDDALAKNILSWKDDVFFTEPGKIYSYSSPNYWLAGLLVERIHGKAYADAMAELLFRPLGMTRTTFRPTIALTYPLALGHTSSKGVASVVRPIDNNVAKYPGGSIFSNVVELSRFAIAMLNGGTVDGKRALSSLTVTSLTKPQFYLPGNDKAFYGYGMLGYDIRGVKTIGHGGVSRGYGSTITFAPENRFAVIVLTNVNGNTLPKTRQRALEIFLPLAPEESTTATAKPKISAADLSRLPGTYSHAPSVYKVAVRNGELFIDVDGKEFRMEKSGENEFGYEQGQVLFVPNSEGRAEHIFLGLYGARRID